MMDEAVWAESTTLPGQVSMAGTDVAGRKESSEREEPIMERMDRVVERMDWVVERLELLEQLVKKNPVPESKRQS